MTSHTDGAKIIADYVLLRELEKHTSEPEPVPAMTPEMAALIGPIPLPVEIGNIPATLREMPRWTLWRYQQQGSRWTKPPLQTSGRHAKPTDSLTWTAFDAAVSTYRAGGFDGIGWNVGNGIVGIDLDKVIADDGTIDDRAAEILDRFAGTYCELSPSGKGYRIFVKGDFPVPGKKVGTWLEVYRDAHTLTVTGRAFAATDVTEQQAALDWLYQTYIAATEKPTNTKENEPIPSFVPVGPVDYAERLRLALGNATTAALYSGDIAQYPSRSEAELALAIRLLTFADGNTDIVAGWLDASGCTKWLERNKQTDVYRSNTLRAALDGWDKKPFVDKWEVERQHGKAVADELIRNRQPSNEGGKPVRDIPGQNQDVPGKEPGFTFCDLRQLRTAALPPPAFIVNPLIPRGHLTLFGGHGGSGKTTVAFVLAAHVACGQAWRDLPVASGKVLIASFEDGQDLILWRLKNIVEEYGLDFDAIENNLTVIDATESDAIMTEAANGGIRNVISTADGQSLIDHIQQHRYDLVIIDNASDAFDGDENHRRQVRRFVRFCANSVSAHNGAIVLLAHIDKSAARHGASGNSYSGSTGWHNSARSRLALIDNELRQEKLNVGKAMPEPIPLVWTDKAVPIPADSDGARLAQSLMNGQDDKALLACFAVAASIGDTVPAAKTRNTAYQLFSTYQELPKTLRDDRLRFQTGMTRLLRSCAIREETYRDENRKERKRLVLSAHPTNTRESDPPPAAIPD